MALESYRKRLGLHVRLVGGEGGNYLRVGLIGDFDRVLDAVAGALAGILDAPDEVPGQTFLNQGRGQRRVEHDGERRPLGRGVAGALLEIHKDLRWLQCDRRAVLQDQLDRLAGVDAGRHRRRIFPSEGLPSCAKTLAVLRPEHAQVWPDVVGDHLAEVDERGNLLDVQFVKNLVLEPQHRLQCRRVTAVDKDAREWLADFDTRLGARCPAHADDLEHRPHVARQRLVHRGRVRLRVIRQVHRGGRRRIERADEVAVDRFGHKGDEWGQQPREGHQAVIEGLVRRGLVTIPFRLPKAAAVASDVPVGQLVDDEALDGSRGTIRIVGVETVPHSSHELVEPCGDPAVEEGPLRERDGRGGARVKTVETGVRDEE